MLCPSSHVTCCVILFSNYTLNSCSANSTLLSCYMHIPYSHKPPLYLFSNCTFLLFVLTLCTLSLFTDYVLCPCSQAAYFCLVLTLCTLSWFSYAFFYLVLKPCALSWFSYCILLPCSHMVYSILVCILLSCSYVLCPGSYTAYFYLVLKLCTLSCYQIILFLYYVLCPGLHTFTLFSHYVHCSGSHITLHITFLFSLFTLCSSITETYVINIHK